jgi:hypothetical protein
MWRLIFFFSVLVTTAWPATMRLYLQDGTFHKVSEYEVKGERVRFYSIERSQWEEIPVELADLKRTEGELKEKQEERKEEAAFLDAEEKAIRAEEREVSQIPMEPGVFIAKDGKVEALTQAEADVVNNKRRSILKAITPIPIVAGKSTVELKGAKSSCLIASERPEFYFRLASDERFGILKLTPTKDSRIVQNWSIIPVSNEIIEDNSNLIETFKQQLGEGLYKLWPAKPLEPGEYAVVEYTEGKGNIQVWDFSVPLTKTD